MYDIDWDAGIFCTIGQWFFGSGGSDVVEVPLGPSPQAGRRRRVSMMVRLWLTLTVSCTVSPLAVSSATGQQAEAVSDAQIVQTLAPGLNGVRLGRMETLNEERRRKTAGDEDIGFRFEQDLNSDGQQELILLGDYAEGDRRRSFVLIARRQAGQWARPQLLTFDEDFVIGRRYNDKLVVFFCTGCDYGGSIEWTGSDYEYRPAPPAGVR
jgi:hypothetical protein